MSSGTRRRRNSWQYNRNDVLYILLLYYVHDVYETILSQISLEFLAVTSAPKEPLKLHRYRYELYKNNARYSNDYYTILENRLNHKLLQWVTLAVVRY